MKVSALIGLEVVHATDEDIAGKISDVLFDRAIAEVAFVLVDMTTPSGTAPVMFSPAVLTLDDDKVKVSAHPADVTARVEASIHRTKVPIDPADLPNTLIGPFGNTISPSMIAALFNARTDAPRPATPHDADAVWFTELQGHAVRAHVADVAQLHDIHLDADFTRCEHVELTTSEGGSNMIAPGGIRVQRSPEGALVLLLTQSDDHP